MMRTARAWAGLALGAILALGGAAGCDGDETPMTDAFVGTWVYAGALTANCGATPVDPVDLTGSMVTITKTGDDRLRIVLGSACMVDFMVEGSKASALPNQNCSFDVPSLGPQMVAISSWTLTVDGDAIDSSFAGGVLICTIAGDGTLTR